MNKRTLLALPLILILAGPCLAQDEREIDQVRERISHMIHEADDLQAAGRTEKAQVLREEAAKLKRHLVERIEHAKRGERGSDRHEIMEGLERGIVALKKLGREEEAHHLQRLAAEVRQDSEPRRREGERTERQVAIEQIEIMQMAMPALREGERRDAADLLEHAIHARKLGLEGRRDEEAAHIRESAPSLGNQAEILMLAAELWQEFGNREKAQAVGHLGRQFAEQSRARQRRGQERERPEQRRTEREVAQEQIEIMEIGIHGLEEAGKLDAADLLERAFRARLMNLQGRRDEESMHIREASPSLGEQAELLGMSARIWAEFGHERKVDALRRLSSQFREKAQRQGRETERSRKEDRRDRAERPGVDGLNERVAHIERRLEEMSARLNRMANSLEKIADRMQRE